MLGKRTEIFLAEPLHCAAFVSREQDGSAYLAARIAAFVSAHGAIRLCADCVGRLPKRSLATRRVTEPGWCESCGSHGADAFRLPLAEYARALRRRAAGTASRPERSIDDDRAHGERQVSDLFGAIEPTDSARLVFRPDGRVEHGRCPDPVCPWCLQAVAPSEPRLRSGRDIFHRDCLRASRSERLISGGSAASPWTAIFDEQCGRQAHRDRRAFAEFQAVTREAVEYAIGVRALARSVRSDSAARRMLTGGRGYVDTPPRRTRWCSPATPPPPLDKPITSPPTSARVGRSSEPSG